jgi:broad specificity phosphatase PhoE
LFRDGCPAGESPAEIGARADRVVSRVRAVDGDVLPFSTGHFLRVLAARRLDLEPVGGRLFLLGAAGPLPCWATNTTSPSRPSGCGTTRITWKGHERWPN